jgi:heptosyltransferase II
MGVKSADAAARPLLLVPYTWIGDFVRCHTVVSIAKSRWPDRPVDILSSRLCAPLVDYMPGVRKAIAWDLPRGRLGLGDHRLLARRLRQEDYGSALIMSRKWKAALAPFLAGIPERVGVTGEVRFGLINDLRWNEKKLARMADLCASLALPPDARLPDRLPPPVLTAPEAEIAEWRWRNGLAEGSSVVALCPGAAGPGKRWPVERFAELARRLRARGVEVWVLGGPDERASAAEISNDGTSARDLSGEDLRNAVLALAAADAAVANDSGLLHVAAALGTPAVGLYGPTSPALWAPLNPLAAAIEAAPSGAGLSAATSGDEVRHRRMGDIAVEDVARATERALGLEL